MLLVPLLAVLRLIRRGNGFGHITMAANSLAQRAPVLLPVPRPAHPGLCRPARCRCSPSRPASTPVVGCCGRGEAGYRLNVVTASTFREGGTLVGILMIPG